MIESNILYELKGILVSAGHVENYITAARGKPNLVRVCFEERPYLTGPLMLIGKCASILISFITFNWKIEILWRRKENKNQG
jgi:hypothetical protein